MANKNPSSYKSAQDQIKERVSQVMDVALSKDSKSDPKLVGFIIYSLCNIVGSDF